MLSCRAAAIPGEIDLVRELFAEYEKSIGVSLCFQGFERELAELPGAYAPPAGRLLIARDSERSDTVAGCVALRPLAEGICEMKRLYLREAFRGKGLGRLLVQTLFEEARAAGYRTMRLDTLPSMIAAIPLYRSLGFREIQPYTDNPVPGALFLEKALD